MFAYYINVWYVADAAVSEGFQVGTVVWRLTE